MKLANIVINRAIEVPQEFNVVSSIDKIIPELPTLIVDYNFASKNFPEFDIGEIKIKHNFYWTFKRSEKRDKFEEDLRWFIKMVYSNLTTDITYVFVDPLQYNRKTLVKIITKINNLSNPIGFLDEEMVYIYSDKLVFGVDLKLLRYLGFNINKLKLKLQKKCKVFLEEQNTIIEYKKATQVFNNQIRFAPFLYSIRVSNSVA